MNVIAIIGMPCTGKSTLLQKLMGTLGLSAEVKRGLCTYNDFPLKKVCVIGKYDMRVFPGTDALSMACAEDCKKLVATYAYQDDWTVIFEGDRLTTYSFFDYVIGLNATNNVNLIMLHLIATDDVIVERAIKRGQRQDKKWLQSRETKLNTILKKYPLHITTIQNNNLYGQESALDVIKAIIARKGS